MTDSENEEQTLAEWESQVLHQGDPGLLIRPDMCARYRFLTWQIDDNDYINLDRERNTITLWGITYALSLFETFGTEAIGHVVKITDRQQDGAGGVVMLESMDDGMYNMQEAVDSLASHLRLSPIGKKDLGEAIREAYWRGVAEGSAVSKENADADTDETSR